MTNTTEISEVEQARRGAIIREILRLKAAKGYPDRVNTDWGTKTDLGLFRMLERLVLDGE